MQSEKVQWLTERLCHPSGVVCLLDVSDLANVLYRTNVCRNDLGIRICVMMCERHGWWRRSSIRCAGPDGPKAHTSDIHSRSGLRGWISSLMKSRSRSRYAWPSIRKWNNAMGSCAPSRERVWTDGKGSYNLTGHINSRQRVSFAVYKSGTAWLKGFCTRCPSPARYCTGVRA